ncbi:MAG: ribulose-phosphate 3-epimerase [Patescibacteria group bacterium]|nr:ribulose-phosphate 3-epimerase [Patescibacteria group bacterium]
MKKIIPAVLAANLEEFNQKLDKAASFFDEIQIDIVEGAFANNETVEPVNIPSLPTGKDYQMHLMVTDPVDYLVHCKRLGAKTIVFHNEIEKDTAEIIEKIREQNFNVFLAIAPESELETFEKYISQVDGIVLMGVNPGFAGQEFEPKVLEKIKELRSKYPDTTIEIDGGISKDIIKELFDAGANILVVNSLFFKAEDPETIVKELNLFLK